MDNICASTTLNPVRSELCAGTGVVKIMIVKEGFDQGEADASLNNAQTLALVSSPDGYSQYLKCIELKIKGWAPPGIVMPSALHRANCQLFFLLIAATLFAEAYWLHFPR
jgi:hypothetical protein